MTRLDCAVAGLAFPGKVDTQLRVYYDPTRCLMSKESTRVRRSFTPQFKRDAVGLVQQGKSVTEVARSLGIARSLLQRWKEQLESKKEEAFPGNGKVSSDRERIRALEKELRDVREERDILKKALAYFADDQK
jgi:transposase